MPGIVGKLRRGSRERLKPERGNARWGFWRRDMGIQSPLLNHRGQNGRELGLAVGNGGVSKAWKISFRQEQGLALEQEQQNAWLAAVESGVQDKLVAHKGARDGKEHFYDVNMAIFDSKAQRAGAVRHGVGQWKEKGDAVEASVAGRQAKSCGIVRFGVADGGEKLDAIDMAIANCELKSKRLVGFGVAERNEELDTFEMPAFGGPAKGKRIAGFGVVEGHEERDAFDVPSLGGPLQRRVGIDRAVRG